MAGVAGNLYTVAYAKQSAKGATGTTGGFKMKLTSGDVGPQRQLLTLAETDASRQQGSTVVVGAQIQGTPEWYARPADFGLFAYAALGANVDAGSGPYTHTATPATSPPYLTIAKNVGAGLIIDQYFDNRIGTLNLSGGAGQAILCQVETMGLTALFGATDSATAVVSDLPFTYPMACLSLGGSPPATVEAFTFNINNNADFIQADCALGPYDVVMGRLAIDGSFTYLLQSDADYRNFHTGSPTGTAFSTVLFQEAVSLTLNDSLGDTIVASTAGAAITAYPVTPDTSGKPIRVAATWSALPQSTAAAYCTIVTTNTHPAY